jgi:hypothetical protein
MKIIITESQYRILKENIQIIDDILDKMGEIGYENLENNEKMTLNRYSEWLNSGKKGDFMDEITPKNDDFGGKVGEEFSTFLPDGSELSFRYDYSDYLDNENIHYGSVNWHGEEWIGLVATDKGDEITEIDFIMDYDALQSYDEDDEMGGYDEGREVRLQNELGNNIHQVKFFFQEEVIPNLID